MSFLLSFLHRYTTHTSSGEFEANGYCSNSEKIFLTSDWVRLNRRSQVNNGNRTNFQHSPTPTLFFPLREVRTLRVLQTKCLFTKQSNDYGFVSAIDFCTGNLQFIVHVTRGSAKRSPQINWNFDFKIFEIF